MHDLGKTILVIGLVVAAIGLALMFSDKLPFGRLPGDIVIERKNFRFYFPLATGLIISIILTLLLNLFRK